MCIKSEFKENCLRLATNGRSNKGFLLTSKVCPQGFFCPCPGAIYMYKIIKNVYKIRFRRDHFETHNIWAFLLSKKICPQWVVCPCLGLYTFEKKNIKNGKKKYRLQRDFFKLASNGQSDKEFLFDIKILSPKGLSVPALGLYTGIKSFKMCLKTHFKEIVLKLATNGQSDKGFLLTSTFVPKGLPAPALGLYTCIKALKYIPGPGVRWVLQDHWSFGFLFEIYPTVMYLSSCLSSLMLFEFLKVGNFWLHNPKGCPIRGSWKSRWKPVYYVIHEPYHTKTCLWGFSNR